MIIRSIRLKNIKSYGDGGEGNGITVDFQPGVNRIAGRNGHGKSTLIEAVGYALFLVEPVFAERFATETYFLREGTKEGEIDVTFEHGGGVWKIERGMGSRSKRRAKVIDLADGSIGAEGDKEVAHFLCELLGLPSARHLSEVFSKLVGVKQGRLIWPFDSKSSEAKRFFNPLFDVEIFRECFNGLRPVSARFRGEVEEQRRRLAGVDERIRERADSREQFAAVREEVVGFEAAEKAAVKARDAACKEKDAQESREKALLAAERERDKAAAAVEKAGALLAVARRQVEEAKQAEKLAADAGPAHEAYGKAEGELAQLDKKREARDGLKRERDQAETGRRDRAAKAEAARELAATHKAQKKSKADALGKLREESEAVQKKLAAGEAAFVKEEERVGGAINRRASVEGWVGGLAAAAKRQDAAAREVARIDAELRIWDPAKLESAVARDKAAETALAKARNGLNKAEQKRETLSGQLEQISGGVCPFLKEACRQFDPERVQSDLSAQEGAIGKHESAVASAQEERDEAGRQLEALRRAESQRVGRREALDRARDGFAGEARQILPGRIRQAAGELAAWQGEAAAPPEPPGLPEGELDAAAVASVNKSVAAFATSASRWWKGTVVSIEAKLKAFEEVRSARTRDAERLAGLEKQSSDRKAETRELESQAAAKEAEGRRFAEEAAGFLKQVGASDEKLKPFAGIDDQSKDARARRDANREGHEAYLQARKLAADLPARATALDESRNAHATAGKARAESEAALKSARDGFDPVKLKAARARHDESRDRVTEIQTNLTHARTRRAELESRFREWEKAVAERDGISGEIDRLAAAIDITELARNTLQKAAPAVAQHLCDRIASRAQVVYNRINPDPIELTWDARNYSLRIIPGDRRFAMLSGGEQTKLALALTLAMIEEFGGLRFCIFDEPTYGVDAESRRKLADAILEAQAAAGLDQLLLVSHDDAFEGKIEHAILLRKTAGESRVVEEG